jgi:hypothetical protein
MDKDTSRTYDPVPDALVRDPRLASDPERAAQMQRVLRRDVQELWDSNFPWPTLEVAAEQLANELLDLFPVGTPDE